MTTQVSRNAGKNRESGERRASNPRTRGSKRPEARSLQEKRRLFWLRAGFWCSLLVVAGLQRTTWLTVLVTPDVLMTIFVYVAAGLLIRIRTGEGGWTAFALLGVCLGLGYLTKTAVPPRVAQHGWTPLGKTGLYAYRLYR